jgi:hypothetical protein
MFGYQESFYKIEKKASIQTRNGEQIVEIRVDEYSKYISIYGKAIDIIFLYNNEEDMNKDWQRIISEPEVKVSELLWHEKIISHSTGYTKDGCVIMY